MYIAMNRFKIELGKEGVFENLWLSRDSHLKNISGFISFNLLKGAAEENFTLYASHSMWNSQKDFLIGLNLKLSEQLIKMQVVILIFILAILFSKGSK